VSEGVTESYPGARYDSESYTYGYLFSRELFQEWEWTEHFVGQPENERYFNQSDFIAGLIDFAREHADQVIEVPKALEDEWTTMVNEAAVTMSPFNEKSYFFGTNIPGKARAFLLNSLGRPKLLEMMEGAAKNDYAGFFPAPEHREHAGE